MGNWNAPHSHARQWRRVKHRRHRSFASPYLRYATIALAAVLLITLAWRGIRWTAHPYVGAPFPSSYGPLAASADTSSDPRTAAWQRDFNDALTSATQDVADGRVSAAEVAVDRAETIVTTQRLISADAKPEFFEPALATLDRIIAKQPDDARLREHVTLARISLAEFRSSLVPEPALSSDAKRVAIGVPREVAAGDTLDPASFGGRILDATLMPGTAEILLPPSSRAFADNVRVENLTVQGAAQTLDGLRWHNVTFIDTRLRYEGGELDLQDVRFVRCRFGFDTGDRGARLATAIALGQNSITLP